MPPQEGYLTYIFPVAEGSDEGNGRQLGNSIGLRIPKDIATRTGLCVGTRVEVEADGDRIVITPSRPRYVLTDLLRGMTPEAMREAFDWGPDKGREIIE